MHVILTDVDDTLLNYGDAMQDFMESKGFVIKDRMREHHNIPKLYGIDLAHTLDLIREFHRSPAMGQLDPEPCAKVVLPALHKRGHRFIAISACLNEPAVVERRRQNLRAAFGFEIEVRCLGLTLDKQPALCAFPPSIWVEDMWDNAVVGAEMGHRTFLLHRPYNLGEHPHVARMQNWYEIAQEIDRNSLP